MIVEIIGSNQIRILELVVADCKRWHVGNFVGFSDSDPPITIKDKRIRRKPRNLPTDNRDSPMTTEIAGCDWIY
jgi:hypothetical protein